MRHFGRICLRIAMLSCLLALAALIVSPGALALSAAEGFNSDVDGTIRAVPQQADGRLLIGGSFTAVGGGSVYSMVVQPDGKLALAGDFNQVATQSRGGVARFSANGTLDTGFSANTDGTVYALAAQTDGKFVLGGFSRLSPDWAGRISRDSARPARRCQILV